MWTWATGLVVLGVLGCGGVVERGEKEDTESPGSGDEPADPSGQADSGLDPSVGLGKCGGGFDRYELPERDCNWVVEDICYEDKLDACACACPKGTVSTTCSSGFPQQDGRVPVYCS